MSRTLEPITVGFPSTLWNNAVLSVPTHPRGERPVAGKLPPHPEAELLSVGRTESPATIVQTNAFWRRKTEHGYEKDIKSRNRLSVIQRRKERRPSPMRPIIWSTSILFVTPVWSQPARRTVDLRTIAQPEARSLQRGVSRIRPLALSATSNAAAPVQAPGVIQTNLFDASNVVWFVTAEKLPSGTRISPFLVFPDQSELPLDSVSLTEEVAPGTSFDLPNIRRFGPFCQQGSSLTEWRST
jgi:hypothetical protein